MLVAVAILKARQHFCYSPEEKGVEDLSPGSGQMDDTCPMQMISEMCNRKCATSGFMPAY